MFVIIENKMCNMDEHAYVLDELLSKSRLRY